MNKLTGYIILSVCLLSCKPRIFFFDASPRTVTSKDSVTLTWKIRGKPTMLYDQKKIASTQGDSINILEFTLVAEKSNKPPAHLERQVTLLGAVNIETMVIRVEKLNSTGDTAIATGITDTSLWKGVSVNTVSANLSRVQLVQHNGHQAFLSDTMEKNRSWQGDPYMGRWTVIFPLTTEEKNNHSLIPSRIPFRVAIFRNNQ
jgi:hypothetical protein